ncbi:MAG: hypothetical protein RIC81_11260 [Microcella pacifica]|uniref:hypothetical protein n=1 Tax=Microcella pacifica TaxID=2591847 RepID=UPI003314ABEC
MTGRPHAVLRASLGRWGAALILAVSAVVVGAIALALEGVVPTPARLVVAAAALLSFGWLVVAVWVVTLRWRTSVRSDGEALVVRGPLGASVIPFHAGLSIGRWLDRRQRPRLWGARRAQAARTAQWQTGVRARRSLRGCHRSESHRSRGPPARARGHRTRVTQPLSLPTAT